MKKILIRGVALVLIALSFLVLASACEEWYDTTYIVKAYGDKWEKWYELTEKEEGKGVKIKVSLVEYDDKEGVPKIVKISIPGKTIHFKDKDSTPAYGVRSVSLKKGTIQEGELKGKTKYYGSYDEYGDGVVVFIYSFYQTTYKSSGSSSRNDAYALRIDYKHDGNYVGTFYAYNVDINDVDFN